MRSGRSAGTCLSPRLSSGHKADKIQISPLLTPPPQSSGAARHRAKRLVRSDLPPTRFVWIIQLKPNFSLASQSSSKPEDQRNFVSCRSVNTIVSFFFRLFTLVFSPPPAHRFISASFFEAFPSSRFAPVASLRRRDQTRQQIFGLCLATSQH